MRMNSGLMHDSSSNEYYLIELSWKALITYNTEFSYSSMALHKQLYLHEIIVVYLFLKLRTQKMSNKGQTTLECSYNLFTESVNASSNFL